MNEAWIYEIRVQGWIGERWLPWFEDMAVRACDDGPLTTTTLSGPLRDQAALLGILQRLYTLGLPLLLVQRQGVQVNFEKGGTHDAS